MNKLIKCSLIIHVSCKFLNFYNKHYRNLVQLILLYYFAKKTMTLTLISRYNQCRSQTRSCTCRRRKFFHFTIHRYIVSGIVLQIFNKHLSHAIEKTFYEWDNYVVAICTMCMPDEIIELIAYGHFQD